VLDNGLSGVQKGILPNYSASKGPQRGILAPKNDPDQMGSLVLGAKRPELLRCLNDLQAYRKSRILRQFRLNAIMRDVSRNALNQWKYEGVTGREFAVLHEKQML